MDLSKEFNDALTGLCDEDVTPEVTTKTTNTATGNKRDTDIKNIHDSEDQRLNTDAATVANTSVNSAANQTAIQDTIADRLQGYKNRYDATKYKNDVHANQDLAKNAPFGQGNKLSYDETLQRQRDLDAFNNQLWLKPASAGYRTNSSFGSTGAPSIGELYKQSPLETEEARQMQINRSLEQYLRQRGITRAEDIRDYTVEFQKNNDRALNTLALQIGTNNAAVEKALQDAIISVGYTVPQTQRITAIANAYAQQLYTNNKTKELKNIVEMFNNGDMEWADKLMSALGLGQVPSIEDLVTQDMFAPLYQQVRSGEMKPAEFYRTMAQCQAILAAVSTIVPMQMFSGAINAGATGLIKGAR